MGNFYGPLRLIFKLFAWNETHWIRRHGILWTQLFIVAFLSTQMGILLLDLDCVF